MSFQIPLILVAMHFLADFVLQTDWMAINKSKRWDALAIHAGIYAVTFVFFGVEFMWITFVTHFVTDAITSRITSLLWRKNERHWFFVVIGADQLIHYVTLALTYNLLR